MKMLSIEDNIITVVMVMASTFFVMVFSNILTLESIDTKIDILITIVTYAGLILETVCIILLILYITVMIITFIADRISLRTTKRGD